MGAKGSMGKGHDMGAMGSMGKGHDMGTMDARPAARMGAALGVRVAEFLEMDRQELGEAVRGGASIADLAGDRVDELVADLVARATERIEQAVTDGRLDRDRADEILARVEERITARLNGGQPTGPAGS
jgi:phage-related minor tail protein